MHLASRPASSSFVSQGTARLRCHRRGFAARSRLSSHENPLGLPRAASTPPNLAARMKRGLPEKRNIPNVKRVIAISSAKGGVGKSTIAANLALASARLGLSTGILDADIYGPSVPTLFNLEDLEPELDSKNCLVPLTAYGVKAMSMGFLIPKDSPVAWRGLMLQKALNQLLFEVSWPQLDLLVLDLPPGTGDVQLTITQNVVLAGAVIISTPQDLALKDAVRGVEMFKKVNVPILGMVQNMSTFTCNNCGHTHDIFGHDGVKRRCEELGLDLLGDIPLTASICADADAGKPSVVREPGSPQAEAFMTIMQQLKSSLALGN